MGWELTLVSDQIRIRFQRLPAGRQEEIDGFFNL